MNLDWQPWKPNPATYLSAARCYRCGTGYRLTTHAFHGPWRVLVTGTGAAVVCRQCADLIGRESVAEARRQAALAVERLAHTGWVEVSTRAFLRWRAGDGRHLDTVRRFVRLEVAASRRELADPFAWAVELPRMVTYATVRAEAHRRTVGGKPASADTLRRLADGAAVAVGL